MKHKEKFETAAQVPHWTSPFAAREQLSQEIDLFVKTAAEGTAKLDAALALKVTAGLGKTATALRVIARYGEALLARGHVLIYVPTLDLAERAHADFQILAPGLPSRVVRGRDVEPPQVLLHVGAHRPQRVPIKGPAGADQRHLLQQGLRFRDFRIQSEVDSFLLRVEARVRAPRQYGK